MEGLDDAVRRAAPPALGAVPQVAAQSQTLARVIAGTARSYRTAGWRRILGGSVILAGVFGVGVSAAVAGPALFEWVGWAPDAIVQRTFTIADGSALGLCEVVARVVREGGVPEATAQQRTDDARRFLRDHEWGPAVSSITAEEIMSRLAVEEAHRASLAAGGADVPPASVGLVASQLMGERISEAFDRAGYLQPGVSLEMSGYCGDEPESSAQ